MVIRKYSFEKLSVWEDIRELIKFVYQVTANFPNNEKFGLVNQIRRAAVSVSSNVAEGSSRTSAKDQAHFYQLSFSSLMELLSQFIVSKDLEFSSDQDYTKARSQIQGVAYKINALRSESLKRVGK